MTDFIDLFLRADDEAAMTAALLNAGFLQEETSGVLYHSEASLLMIGAIDRCTGNTTTVAGVEAREWRVVPGYHANVRTTQYALATALAALCITPATPSHVWAQGVAL